MALAATTTPMEAQKTVDLTIVHTTDVHGNFFPRDYINRRPGSGSLARVATYVDSLRAARGAENVILLDGGDILQGQPTVYYYNFVNTVAPHVAARVYNFMNYDAITIGNHDVETGHDVYDRFNSRLTKPMLGANVINTATGEPYFKPYTVIDRGGVKIAILGLLTPAIPAWLPENLWSGMEFEEMVDSAGKWVDIIRENEDPDILIGLFQSGNDASRRTGDYLENASTVVAQSVPGLDIVLTGHDHTRNNKIILNDAGEQVVILNPANNADNISEVRVTLTLDADGDIVDRRFKGDIVNVDALTPSARFLDEFGPEMQAVEEFVGRKLGESTGDFTSREALFGPSSFMRLIHDLQLKITGADISMAAPLSFDATINRGDIRVSDMFNLYKYENLLYVMALTGREIKDYLEESYANWITTMKPGDEHILLFADVEPTQSGTPALKNASYNFDSAAGINYTVDVTAPAGSRVTITGMENGEPFDPDKTYRVAVNSYRGNGGGDLLTRGAGIPREKLAERIVWATDRDMRYYLIKEIERLGAISPRDVVNWQFVPADVAKPAIENDLKILFTK